MRISSSTANLYRRASTAAETTSQALYGESIRILSDNTPWLEIELHTDKYTGFIQSHHVTDKPYQQTHRVNTKATPLFQQADIKSPIELLLVLSSELNVKACEHPNFWKTDTDHFIWKEHTVNSKHTSDEPLVDIAQRFFTGAPYLWGGRSTNGLDCSALVQLSAKLKGHNLPRDTQDQEVYFRTIVSPNSVAKNLNYENPSSSDEIRPQVKLVDYEEREQNDLMYWPGHVAIVADKNTVFHATAHSLDCRFETLAQVEERAGVAHAVWRLQSGLI